VVGGEGGTKAEPGATKAVEASIAASQAFAKPEAPAAGSSVGPSVSNCAWNVAALNVKTKPTAANTLGSGDMKAILAEYQEANADAQLESATGGSAASVLFHVPTGSRAIIFRP